jgi:hypothetical protein
LIDQGLIDQVSTYAFIKLLVKEYLRQKIEKRLNMINELKIIEASLVN